MRARGDPMPGAQKQRDWKRSPKASLCSRSDQLYLYCVVKDVLTLLLRTLLTIRKVFCPVHYEQGSRLVPPSSMTWFM